MKYIEPWTRYNSREWIVIIKAMAWLTVLFYGNPSIHGTIVGWIGRLG